MTRIGLVLCLSCLLFACQHTIDGSAIKDISGSALPKPSFNAQEDVISNRTTPFVSEDGGFSIVFPDSPKVHQHTTVSAVGEIQLTQYIYSQDDTQAWLASYADYPKKMIQLGNKKQLLKGIKYRILEDLRAKTIHEEKIKFNNKYLGLSFSAHAPKRNLDILYKIFLVKHRVYQLSMYSSIGAFSAQDSIDFFGSFQLLKDSTLRAANNKAPAI